MCYDELSYEKDIYEYIILYSFIDGSFIPKYSPTLFVCNDAMQCKDKGYMDISQLTLLLQLTLKFVFSFFRTATAQTQTELYILLQQMDINVRVRK